MRTTVFLHLVVAGLLGGCGGVEIVQDLDEGEADRVLETLSRGGVKASKEKRSRGGRSRFAVVVERGLAVRAWQVMRSKNTATGDKTPRAGIGVGSLLSSPAQKDALRSRALARDIARTLMSVDGVVGARVHVVQPRRLLPTPVTPPRASVLLRVQGPPPLSRPQVQALVKGAVDGLEARDVSVVFVTSSPSRLAASSPQARVGPFVVAASSRGPLLAASISATLLVLGLALGLLVLIRRNRHLSLKLEQLDEAQLDQDSKNLESSLSLLDRSFSHRKTADRKTQRAKRGARR